MRLFSRLHDRCFCAFCKSPRRVYAKKHVDLTNVVGSFLLATAGAYVYHGQLDPRGLPVFGLLLLAAEVFVYLRWRATLVCSLCGFDPILYKRSPALASLKVQEFFRARREDPDFLLTRSPLVEVHRRKLENDRREMEVKRLTAMMEAKRPKPGEPKAAVPPPKPKAAMPAGLPAKP